MLSVGFFQKFGIQSKSEMDHQHHNSNLKLAFSATMHCLLGCGLGEVFGVILGAILGLSYLASIGVGIILGFVFGYLLGILPLIRANMTLLKATKIVIATEFLSIFVMETAEVLTEINFPGMSSANLNDLVFWIGLATALAVGFIAAFPVNLYLVNKGIRHNH